MSANSACIVIECPQTPAISLFKKVGGQPAAILPLISSAMEGYRKHIRERPGRLACLIVGSTGQAKASTFEMFASYQALAIPHDWRYEIKYEAFKPPKLILTEIRGERDILVYDGYLEHYLSKILRQKIPKPRGRTPTGFKSRKEYEQHYYARVRGENPPQKAGVIKEIEEERATSNYVDSNIDLRGVRVFTKEEYKARKRARKRGEIE